MKKSPSPLVSICCIAYNQAPFIRECLDGFLMQETDFAFEVLIHDDASTDGTTEIIKEYEKKYPNIIKPIYETENQWQKGRIGSVVFNFPRIEGKYVALCEGDDYWTDPLKLQKQVDFLDTHKAYSLVFHPVHVFFENNEQNDEIFPTTSNAKYFTIKNLLRKNYIQTNSVMYRKINYDNLVPGVMPADWYLHLFHAKTGSIGFINEVMSSYRRHTGGLWWSTTQKSSDDVWRRYGTAHILLYTELLKLFGTNVELRHIIDEHIEGTVNILNRIDSSDDTNLLNGFVQKYPERCDLLVLSLSRTVYKNYRKGEKDNEIHAKIVSEAFETIEALKEDREAILNSKTYKVGNRIAQVSRIVRRKK